jgi:hypothetical protein
MELYSTQCVPLCHTPCSLTCTATYNRTCHVPDRPCLVAQVVEENNGRWLIASDHGNSDDMVQVRWLTARKRSELEIESHSCAGCPLRTLARPPLRSICTSSSVAPLLGVTIMLCPHAK